MVILEDIGMLQVSINLNRDWLNIKSSEVKAVKKQMKKYGYDLVFDIKRR